MNSASSNGYTSGGKVLNTSFSSHSPVHQQQTQITSPGFESSSERSSHQASPIHAAARNIQSHKKQLINSRKPRLVDEDAMAESGAMRNFNCRRGQTSITHLMNFTLPPRPQDHRNTIGRGTRRGNIFGIGSGHHSSDKARYINANYRFIVKPSGDYRPQSVDADHHLDWNDVLQILASSVSQEASCPICLNHPVAPRMAKCGHIFCLPCLIRYMHSDDDEKLMPDKKARWKKCPICFDSVYISDTRPVRWYTGQEGIAPREGDDVVLRLIMRQPGSTLALPRDEADTLGKSEDVPWYFAAEVTDYARIMKGGEEYMIEQFDNEISTLKEQEIEDELMFGQDPQWTRKAVGAVIEAKEKMKGIGEHPIPKQPVEKKLKRQPIQFNPIEEDSPEMYFIQHASRSGMSMSNGLPGSDSPGANTKQQVSEPSAPDALPTDDQNLTSSPAKQNKPRALSESHHPNAPYFFYQALLHYYLAPLDIRILKSAFGNFASFPSTLLPRVERVSTGHIMDDDLRKRTKYLSHLPYGCEVGFLECNWTDVVAPEILDQFKSEIEKRRRRNRDKENREEKDRLRAEKAEDDARWANARRRRPGMPVESFSEEDFHPLSSSLDTTNGWHHSWEREPRAEDEIIAQVQAASLNGESSGNATPISGVGGQGKKKKAKKITLLSTTARRAA